MESNRPPTEHENSARLYDFYSAFNDVINIRFGKFHVKAKQFTDNLIKDGIITSDNVKYFEKTDIGQQFYAAFTSNEQKDKKHVLILGLKVFLSLLHKFGKEKDKKFLFNFILSNFEKNSEFVSDFISFYQILNKNYKTDSEENIHNKGKFFPFPTFLTRNVIFTLGNTNEYTLNNPISISHTKGWGRVDIGGKILSVPELLTLSSLLYLSMKNNSFEFECTIYNILKNISTKDIRSISSRDHTRIEKYLTNLSNSTIFSYKYTREGKTFSCDKPFNIISFTKNINKFNIKISDCFKKSYAEKQFTWVNLDILSGLELYVSKVLYLFIISHEPYFFTNSLKIDTLIKVLNLDDYNKFFKGFCTAKSIHSKIDRAKKSIVYAMYELVKNNILHQTDKNLISNNMFNVCLKYEYTNPYLLTDTTEN